MSIINVDLSKLILQIKLTICQQYKCQLYNLNQIDRNNLCLLFYKYDISDDVKRTLNTLRPSISSFALSVILDKLQSYINICEDQQDYDILVNGMLDSLNSTTLPWVYNIAFIVNSVSNDLFITYIATSFDSSNPPPLFIIKIQPMHWMKVGSNFYNQ